MSRLMKFLCLSPLLAVLAACTTPSALVDGETSSSTEPVVATDSSPLVVPALAALKDTPARALTGKFQRATWADLPGWSEDDLNKFWPLFLRNCRGLMRQTSGNLAASARATPRVWQPVCAAAVNLNRDTMSDAAVRQFLQTHLQPWRLLGADAKPAANTVTGYYEPLVRGSRVQGGAYQWPLYAVPDDLLTIDLGAVYPDLAGKRVRGKLVGKRVVPYDTRSAIEASNKRLPAIVWVDDPVDNFFLQVQGSGRVLLTSGPDSGKTIRVAYADHNGQPYASIGRWLINQGELRAHEASMQNIRAWAQRNPARVQEMLNANPAVVFSARKWSSIQN
jgi:membrane-bound lytic murein transglycosylase A